MDERNTHVAPPAQIGTYHGSNAWRQLAFLRRSVRQPVPFARGQVVRRGQESSGASFPSGQARSSCDVGNHSLVGPAQDFGRVASDDATGINTADDYCPQANKRFFADFAVINN